VTLLTADWQIIDSVAYQGTAPEGQSYTKFDDDNWQWTESTIGKDNGLPPVTEANNSPDTTNTVTPVIQPVIKTPIYDDSGVKISEIYPAPNNGEKEFLEFTKEAGFYGLQVLKKEFYKEVNGHNFWSVTLRAWKADKGPSCVYIGQFATYLGPYASVTDDEGHTFKAGIPFEICTDTAFRLTQEPYKKFFDVTGPTKKENEAEACCSPSFSSAKNGCC
jgi:hypothetical protein